MKIFINIIFNSSVPGRTGTVNSFPAESSAEITKRPLFCPDKHLLLFTAHEQQVNLEKNGNAVAAAITKTPKSSHQEWFLEPFIKPEYPVSGKKNPFAAGKERGGMPME